MVLILKPTLSCNFRCKYCYLSEDTKTQNKFDVEFAKTLLLQVKDCLLKNKQRIEFLWHGGEPLMWGMDNYVEIFAFIEKEFVGTDYRISIQTNLSLIDNDFIDLFLKYNVSVGFSLDGIKEIHDCQRVDSKGNGTFDTIMEKVTLCKQRKLNLGCIVVASKKHLGHIPELYKFMCDNKIGFKLNPLFNSGEAKKNIDDFGLTPNEYAKLSIELFDLWFYDTENKNYNSKFIDVASSLITRKTSLCSFGKNCQDNFLCVAPNCDVVPCGRFCDSELINFSYGNLLKESLEEILSKRKLSDAYNRNKYIEAGNCKKCRFFDICHGGCLHDGFISGGNFKTKTFLCGAYKKIFSHIERRLRETEML